MWSMMGRTRLTGRYFSCASIYLYILSGQKGSIQYKQRNSVGNFDTSKRTRAHARTQTPSARTIVPFYAAGCGAHRPFALSGGAEASARRARALDAAPG